MSHFPGCICVYCAAERAARRMMWNCDPRAPRVPFPGKLPELAAQYGSCRPDGSPLPPYDAAADRGPDLSSVSRRIYESGRPTLEVEAINALNQRVSDLEAALKARDLKIMAYGHENDDLKRHLNRVRASWRSSDERRAKDFRHFAQHRGACPGQPCECGLTVLRARRGNDFT